MGKTLKRIKTTLVSLMKIIQDVLWDISKGRISFPVGSENYRRQRELLESEGVVFLSGQVDMGEFRWQENGDEWPEEYLEPERRDNLKP